MSLKHKLPIPKRSAEDIYEITPAFLREQGVKLLLMDLDNTLSPYIVDEATQELKQWIETLKAGGIEPFIFSNNKGDRRERWKSAVPGDAAGGRWRLLWSASRSGSADTWRPLPDSRFCRNFLKRRCVPWRNMRQPAFRSESGSLRRR